MGISKKQPNANYASTLKRSLQILLNYDKSTKPVALKGNLGMGMFKHPKGWSTQSAQVGGRPAVAVYRKGKLARVRYLTGDLAPVDAAVSQALPDKLQWQGTRANFRVLGQVRDDVFEAIAVVMPADSTLIVNLTETGSTLAMHNGFTTTTFCKRKKPLAKFPATTVLISTYSDYVRYAWFNRKTGQIVKRLKLARI